MHSNLQVSDRKSSSSFRQKKLPIGKDEKRTIKGTTYFFLPPVIIFSSFFVVDYFKSSCHQFCLIYSSPVAS